jgi:two-component system, NtrC family, sensor histidine kinase HydH
MVVRRLPPLAVAFALMAAALVATAYATQRTVGDAFDVVREGQAYTAEQALRADLVELGAMPTSDELATVLKDHANEGVRYLALADNRGVIAEAGTPKGALGLRERRPLDVVHVGDRLRLERRLTGRRAWGRAIWLVLEVEPVEAAELRGAARRTLAIGLLAAGTLLGVAIALVRRELRRQATERDRERERRLASLGEMSAVLAHEIRNPLASLKGNAQLLASSLPAGEKPRAKADRVVDEAVRLEKLTTDLLAFVRTGQLQRADVDPRAIARDAAAAIDAGDAAVEVEIAGAPAAFSLDAARMREVLVNLIDNAVAAGPPVKVRVAGDASRLVYEVSDKGPGVPAADRDKVFEPFHTGKTRGTGLGLAIAKRMVELHGGTIAIDDAPGGGARFRIEIQRI